MKKHLKATVIAVRVDKDMLKFLETEAKHLDLTLSQVIRRCISWRMHERSDKLKQ